MPKNRIFDALVPTNIRRFFRKRELGLVLASIVLGLISGVVVAGMSGLAHVLQKVLYGLPGQIDLSAMPRTKALRAVLVSAF